MGLLMTDTCDFLVFDAPLPPSLNACNITVKMGKRSSIGKSPQFKKYKKMFTEQFWLTARSKGAMCFDGPLMFWTVVFPARKGCDVDNYNKCIQDCLQAADAFVDDNQINSNRQERGPRISGGMIRCYLASEKYRDELYELYEKELREMWLPQRDNKKILKQPDRLTIRRVREVCSPPPF